MGSRERGKSLRAGGGRAAGAGGAADRSATAGRMQADAARGPGSGRGSSAVRRGATCPLCDRAVEQAYRPFCSKRCADLDLGRWLTGAYAIPGERADPADED